MVEAMPKVRFVLFSAARSGTTLVTDTLKTHPGAYVHAEIYQPRRENHIRDEFRQRFDVEALAKQPQRLARAILDFTPGPPVVGFKMWTWQAPGAANALLRDAGVHKIVLERANKLAAFSSVQLAWKTGRWNRWRGESEAPPAPVLDFDAAEFDAFIERQDKLFANYRAAAAGPVLWLEYLDLPEPGLTRIQDFLGIAPLPLQPRRVKLYGADILARFAPADHAAIRRRLDRLGRPDWVCETRAA